MQQAFEPFYFKFHIVELVTSAVYLEHARQLSRDGHASRKSKGMSLTLSISRLAGPVVGLIEMKESPYDREACLEKFCTFHQNREFADHRHASNLKPWEA